MTQAKETLASITNMFIIFDELTITNFENKSTKPHTKHVLSVIKSNHHTSFNENQKSKQWKIVLGGYWHVPTALLCVTDELQSSWTV